MSMMTTATFATTSPIQEASVQQLSVQTRDVWLPVWLRHGHKRLDDFLYT